MKNGKTQKIVRTATYTIKGPPIPKARPRFGDGRCYDSQKDLKLMAGITLQSQHEGEFFQGPIKIKMDFFLPMAVRKPFLDGKPHIFTPDLSNLVKFIEDVAIGILYKDDCIISVILAAKWFSANPRTELTVMELE